MEIKNYFIKILITSFFVFLVGAILIFWNFSLNGNFQSDPMLESRNTFLDDTACNVAVIPVFGTIVSSVYKNASNTDDIIYADASQIVRKINDAENAVNIRAALLEIDSDGGYMTAPDFILNALDNFSKPKISQIYNTAYSGGYWVAIGTDKIFAQKTSDIGSIGVTQSHLNSSKANEEKGEKYIDISTGEYKTLGDPNRPISEKEIKFMQEKLQKMEDVFVEDIAVHRKMATETVYKLATGETWIAKDALSLGLIDEIGYTKEVNEYLQKLLGFETKEELVFCY
jgi:protease-4